MPTEFSLAEFGAAWQKFIEHVNAQTPPETAAPPLADQIKEFLGTDPQSLIILKESFLERDLPNLQLALDHFLTGPDRSAELTGYTIEHEAPNFSLAMILSSRRWQIITAGPVQYSSFQLAGGERLQCVRKGIYFIRDHGQRAVAFIWAGDYYWGVQNITFEVLCPEAERAEAILSEIRQLAHTHNVYRGQVISLGAKSPDDIRFHSLPPIERDAIILPAGLLEVVERNTLGFAQHAPRLREAGRHLRRGLLFHGPPGTGKTLTLMYLVSRMPERTAILLSGRVMGLIAQSCQLARLLAPSLVVLEDVDLVAEDRDREANTRPLLFELLNEMDGLSPDVDVLFLLSTNRPDLLESALAARPGRVDQAIEFPLPDADSRRRLFQLYGLGLNLQPDSIEQMVRRTEGASPAFIREHLRKAALIAADESRDSAGPLEVTDAHLREALKAILTEGGELTRKLLGAAAIQE